MTKKGEWSGGFSFGSFCRSNFTVKAKIIILIFLVILCVVIELAVIFQIHFHLLIGLDQRAPHFRKVFVDLMVLNYTESFVFILIQVIIIVFIFIMVIILYQVSLGEHGLIL